MAALTDVKLRSLKRAEKLYRVADSGGLCIEVQPSGSRLWRFRYRFGGKAKMLSLGAYPECPLTEARRKRDELRAELRAGSDPSDQRKAAKMSERNAAATSFESVAREWFEKISPSLAPATAEKTVRFLERDVFPWVGVRPIASINAQELLPVLRRIEGRGAVETSHRVHQTCSRIFRYAVVTGRAQRDPAADLRGALAPIKTTHRAAITEPNGLADLLRAIDGYRGHFATTCALRLAPLVFVRPGELRHAEWAEIDLKAAEWRIPAAKMKMRADHIVPLSVQAVEILRELQPLTSRSRYVFPSLRSAHRPMSENTINAALRRLGFDKGQMTGHGFRATASSLLNEQGWNRDAVERQLAHAERNKVRAAYNRAEHLPERRKMMQAWADYLDSLRNGEMKVTPLRRAV